MSPLMKLFEVARSPAWTITVITMFLIYWVTIENKTGQRESAQTLLQVSKQLEAVAREMTSHTAESAREAQAQTRVLRQMCINSATSPQERLGCVQ